VCHPGNSQEDQYLHIPAYCEDRANITIASVLHGNNAQARNDSHTHIPVQTQVLLKVAVGSTGSQELR